MSLTKFLFKQIDFWGYIPQNTYHNKNTIKLAKNQIYSDKNPKKCTLDIYCKKGAENTVQPVFVNLHGGGFVAGDKKYRKSFCEYCTKFDIKVLNVNYSLAPVFNLVQILEQLTTLFKWIKTNENKFGFDTNKIILCGDSAGAYLATWLSVLAQTKISNNSINLSKIDTKVAGVVLFSGIYFPTDSLKERMIFNINHSLWEYLCGEKFVSYEACKNNQLFDFIDIGNYVTSNFPKAFIAHSKSDIFCGDNGSRFTQKLKLHNVPYYEVCSTKNMHDWQENMFTKSAKLTLKHFDSFMAALLSDNITENRTITISKGKLV